jgi:hypothetical protein
MCPLAKGMRREARHSPRHRIPSAGLRSPVDVRFHRDRPGGTPPRIRADATRADPGGIAPDPLRKTRARQPAVADRRGLDADRARPATAAIVRRAGEAALTEDLEAATARLAGFLTKWGRPYALIGGLAIIARVRIRATEDVDALVAVEDSEISDLVALARSEGYDVGATAESDLRDMGLLRMWGPPGKPKGTIADLIVANDPFLHRAMARATPVAVGKTTLPVATLEDLILQKLDADRPRDVEDVLSIKTAFADSLDLAYVRGQADVMGERVRSRVDLYFPPKAG